MDVQEGTKVVKSPGKKHILWEEEEKAAEHLEKELPEVREVRREV